MQKVTNLEPVFVGLWQDFRQSGTNDLLVLHGMSLMELIK